MAIASEVQAFMVQNNCIARVVVAVGVLVVSTRLCSQDVNQVERDAVYQRYLDFSSHIKGGRVEPHWMADGASFWFADAKDDETIIWKVNPQTNEKSILFRFAVANTSADFVVEGKRFAVNPVTGNVTPSLSEKTDDKLHPEMYLPDLYELESPDGRWFLGIREHNVSIRSTTDGHRVQVTNDGVENFAWDVSDITSESWSPDSKKLVAKKYDLRDVPPANMQFARAFARTYGDYHMKTELSILDIDTKRHVSVDLGERAYWIIRTVGWRGSEVLFFRWNRRGDVLDLMAADSPSGKVRRIFRERNSLRQSRLVWVDETRFIWESERTGWNHLYLYDVGGNVVRQLTKGEFPIEHVITVDEENELVYFTAHRDREHPYRTQLYRVQLDGTGFKKLAVNVGQHNRPGFARSWQRIHFSPSKEFFVCNRSTPQEPSVAELRRADGALSLELSRVDIRHLEELHWQAPEEFSVTAADGKTVLHGILYKPLDFDAKKKYPVVDSIYGGPHVSMMELHATFEPHSRMGVPSQALAQLGYVVVVLDSRGTPGRSRDFQNVVYRNMGRHEIPDHVAAIKQLSQERPYMDLSRVGIIGTSFGGYMAIRGMLQAPDFFSVGIATEPFPEDKPLWWRYLGWQEDDASPHTFASNSRLASQLKGKLLLVHGEPAKRAVEHLARAFIDARKFFDVLPIPGANHGFTGSDKSLLARGHTTLFGRASQVKRITSGAEVEITSCISGDLFVHEVTSTDAKSKDFDLKELSFGRLT